PHRPPRARTRACSCTRAGCHPPSPRRTRCRRAAAWPARPSSGGPSCTSPRAPIPAVAPAVSWTTSPRCWIAEPRRGGAGGGAPVPSACSTQAASVRAACVPAWPAAAARQLAVFRRERELAPTAVEGLVDHGAAQHRGLALLHDE